MFSIESFVNTSDELGHCICVFNLLNFHSECLLKNYLVVIIQVLYIFVYLLFQQANVILSYITHDHSSSMILLC